MDSPGGDTDDVRLGDGKTIWRRSCGADRPEGVWKRQALEDFDRWLETLPEAFPEEGEDAPMACDLHALFSAFVSLRQEVRLQNREQARAVRGLEKAIETGREAGDLFRRRSEDLDDLEARIRLVVERRCLLPFLDVRDALVRGWEAAAGVAGQRGLFRRPPVGIEGVVQGYEMAIERFDRALSIVGVTRIETVGRPFDPRTMRAQGVRRMKGVDDEVVVEEFLSGFVRGDEVLRPAEVVVNRS